MAASTLEEELNKHLVCVNDTAKQMLISTVLPLRNQHALDTIHWHISWTFNSFGSQQSIQLKMSRNEARSAITSALQKLSFFISPAQHLFDALSEKVSDIGEKDFIKRQIDLICEKSDLRGITVEELYQMIINVFFVSDTEKNIDHWNYYDQIDRFVESYRDRFFPNITTFEHEIIPRFEVFSRQCSLEIMRIIRYHARDTISSHATFEDIIMAVYRLYDDDPVSNAGANTIACHRSIYEYLKANPAGCGTNLINEIAAPFDVIWPNIHRRYGLPTDRANTALYHLIEFAKLADLGEFSFKWAISGTMKENPDFEGALEAIERLNVMDEIHTYRVMHGSRHFDKSGQKHRPRFRKEDHAFKKQRKD
jgi:hypothetical protein